MKYTSILILVFLLFSSVAFAGPTINMHAVDMATHPIPPNQKGMEQAHYDWFTEPVTTNNEAMLYTGDGISYENWYWIYLYITNDTGELPLAVTYNISYSTQDESVFFSLYYDIADWYRICSPITNYCVKTAHSYIRYEEYDPFTEPRSRNYSVGYSISQPGNSYPDTTYYNQFEEEVVLMGVFYIGAYEPSRIEVKENQVSTFGETIPSLFDQNDNPIPFDVSQAYVNFGMQTSIKNTTWSNLKRSQ